MTDTSSLTQSTDTLLYKLSKNAIDTVLEYTAEDSMVLDVPGKLITLYGKKATTNYNDNDLSAPVISFDQATGDIIASIKRDSAGKVISMPTYKQADFLSQSDSIRFNMKTGKGLTKSTYTQQGEMYVYGDVIKKIDNNVFYALRGRFTTCDLDTPHFAFISNKIKFINNKVAITGPVHPEFEGIPIPIYLPFGIYPLSQGRHSGFLPPNFTANEQRGLGLEGLGYYKVINDLLKGKEYIIPEEYAWKDKDGHDRTENRIKWWRDARQSSYGQFLFNCPPALRDKMMNENVNPIFYSIDAPPVFFGHYWLEDSYPVIQAANVICLDYSIAKGGSLVAYRWNGEEQINDRHFVSVKFKE